MKIKQWGGPGVALNLHAEEGRPDAFAIEFDCAHGTLTQIPALDSQGNFSVKGTFTPEHGGPVRSDEPDRTQPATYFGQVKGNTMTLRITLPDGTQPPGPFTLQANAAGRIVKCL